MTATIPIGDHPRTPSRDPAAALRILCFLHGFDPGGVERMALRLCRAWADSGHHTVLVTGRDGGPPDVEMRTLHHRPLSRRRSVTRRFETAWMILRLPREVRRARPDVLFCAGNSYSIVAVALRMLLGPTCPPIVAKISNDMSRRDMPRPLRALYHRWCRLQGRAIDRFVALSEPMRDEAAAILEIEAARIAVIPDPVLSTTPIDPRAAIRSRRRPGRRFLAIGRLAPQKDFATLIRAFADGAHDEDRLVILGDGPERAMLERLVRKYGMAGRISLPGHATPVEPWLAQADVFVLSSRYEGVPAVVVEARAAGLPVIATDSCRSMEWLLADSPGSTLVPVDDPVALARAIAAPRVRDVAPGTAVSRHRLAPSSTAYAALFAQTAATVGRMHPLR